MTPDQPSPLLDRRYPEPAVAALPPPGLAERLHAIDPEWRAAQRRQRLRWPALAATVLLALGGGSLWLHAEREQAAQTLALREQTALALAYLSYAQTKVGRAVTHTLRTELERGALHPVVEPVLNLTHDLPVEEETL